MPSIAAFVANAVLPLLPPKTRTKVKCFDPIRSENLIKAVLLTLPFRTPRVHQSLRNFINLVLGCIESDFCMEIVTLQDFLGSVQILLTAPLVFALLSDVSQNSVKRFSLHSAILCQSLHFSHRFWCKEKKRKLTNLRKSFDEVMLLVHSLFQNSQILMRRGWGGWRNDV